MELEPFGGGGASFVARGRWAMFVERRIDGSQRDGFISVDRGLHIRFADLGARRVLAVSAPQSGDVTGAPLGALLPPSVREQLEASARRSIDEQTPLRLEQHVDDPERWFDVSLQPSDGELSIFIRDITDAKHAELALRRSERRHTILADTGQLLESGLSVQTTLDRLAHLLVRWLCDWCVIYVPVPGGARRAMLAGREPDVEALARRAIGDVHPESLETPTIRVLRTGRSVLVSETSEGTIEASNGSHEYARLLREHPPHSIINVPLVARGHTIAAMALASSNGAGRFTEEDLSLAEEIARRAALAVDSARLYEEATRRALAESALRKAAAAVTAQLTIGPVLREIARNALIALDATGAFVERVDGRTQEAIVVASAGEDVPSNGASTPYHGSFAHHVLERGQPERIPDLGEADRLVPKVLTTRCRGCPALVVPLLREEARGALFFIRGRGAAEFGDDEVARGSMFGELAGLAFRKAYLLDLSERRRADAEAASLARDEVLAIVTHDLRNPLHAISMAAALLDDQTACLDPAKHHEECTIIIRSSERMNRLIQDLLDVSRIEAKRFTVKCECEDPLQIAHEVFGAFRRSAETHGLHARTDIRDGTRLVYVDRDRIMQALNNFLDNAVKFAADGSEVVLRVGPDAAGTGIQFSIADHGNGIAPDALPHVFERYWQVESTAHHGAGLGLAIAKGIAEVHHGRVWAESTVGEGSTFHLWLPYADPCPPLPGKNPRPLGRAHLMQSHSRSFRRQPRALGFACAWATMSRCEWRRCRRPLRRLEPAARP